MMDDRLKYLSLLANDYPNLRAVSREIINLKAIMALPKGTEYFLSDLHGEHEAFVHMIKSASGVIRAKIEELFAAKLPEEERDKLASLIYNPKAELARRKKDEKDIAAYYKKSIYEILEVMQSCSTKYTRSKVRKRLPKQWDYIMDELLHADDEANRAFYYNEIIDSIIELGNADDFIAELANSTCRLAVDQLHIVGDIFDRGPHPEDIMEFLMEFHDVDFQWGNHDMLWMGAAVGNWACIANVLRNNISYNNFDMLEIGYGINLRPLQVFANRYYKEATNDKFIPKFFDDNKFDPVSPTSASRMNKAITIVQLKVEGQRIMEHPEYHLDHRMLLDKIDYENGTVTIEGEIYKLNDTNFPTIDPADPYKLTEAEIDLMKRLEASFVNSKKLQEHIRFMFDNGGMYKVENGNLMFHACIPMTADGEFDDVEINGRVLSGKALFDYIDEEARKTFFNLPDSEENGLRGDMFWFLWNAPKSPMFGKHKMTTFERKFIDDKATHKEPPSNYYELINDKEICIKILKEFGLDESCHVINGHVPVKVKDGVSPIRGDGKLIVIDGGIAKAYQKDTGIAGYTFIYNSRYMAIAEHKPYTPLNADGSQEFHTSQIRIVENFDKRMMIRDTDHGAELQQQIDDLMLLAEAYRTGELKEA